MPPRRWRRSCSAPGSRSPPASSFLYCDGGIGGSSFASSSIRPCRIRIGKLAKAKTKVNGRNGQSLDAAQNEKLVERHTASFKAAMAKKKTTQLRVNKCQPRSERPG